MQAALMQQGSPVAKPLANLSKMINFADAFEYRLVIGFCDLVYAGVVRTPFHIRGGKFRRQNLLQKRNVLLHQLLLQIFRARGDDYSLVVF